MTIGKLDLRNRQLFLFTAIVIFMVYLFSAPKGVVLEDDGLFLMAAWFNGIAHPPGYPLYTLFSHLATWIPAGTVAYRVHLLSAIFSALACGVLFLIINKLTSDKYAAVTASVAYGLSPVYWSQSIVAEVYSLNVLIFLLLFYLSLIYVDQDETKSLKTIILIGLLYGVGLSNHWPLILLSSPLLLIILLKQKRRLFYQTPYIIPFILLGLLPYMWLIKRSRINPEISFYGPLNSLSEIWFFISREGFSSIDQSYSAVLYDKFQYVWFVLTESIHQFGIVGFIFIVAGMVSQKNVFNRRIIIALIVGYLCNTLVLVGLLNFDFDFLHQSIFRVYPLIAYSILSIWLAIGLSLMTTNVIPRFNIKSKTVKLSVIVLILGSTIASSIPQNLRANDDYVELYAKTVLGSLPEQSVLFLDNDFSVGPLGYQNKVENYRKDIELMQPSGLIFKNRLFRGDNKINEEDRIELINLYIRHSDKAIFYDKLPSHAYAVKEYGLYSAVDKSGQQGLYQFILNENILNYFIDTFNQPVPIDAWKKILYRYHEQHFCYLMSGLASYTNLKDKKEMFHEMVDQYCDSYYGKLGLVKRFLLDDEIDINAAQNLIASAIPKVNEAITKEDRATIYNFQGLVNIMLGEWDLATQNLNKSLGIWLHQENDAHRLRQILEAERQN